MERITEKRGRKEREKIRKAEGGRTRFKTLIVIMKAQRNYNCISLQ